MRKEVIVAIIIGITFGLVVAYGMRIAKQSLDAKALPSPTPLSARSESPTRADHTILITTPESDEIISASPFKIIGTTSPLSMVSARILEKAVTGIADETGAFTLELTASPGPNIVAIDSFHPEGDNAHIEFTTVLSSADLDATPAAKTNKNEKKSSN